MSETGADYDLLATFVAVARERSFTRAAKKRGVTKGTISRAISRLEEQLGSELVRRNTRAVSLSSSGAVLYERVASHFEALDQAVHGLPEGTGQPSGELRITTTEGFAMLVLPEILVHFAQVYPDVRVHLVTTGATVDLVAEGFDLAIRVARTRMKDSNLVARRLGRLAFGFYASPAYLSRRGKPSQLDDPRHRWVLHPQARKKLRLPASAHAAFLCDSFQVAYHLAAAGGGITYVPHFVAAAGIRTGQIVQVQLAKPKPHSVDMFMVYPSHGQLPRKVTAFRDFLLDWLAKAPVA